MALLDQCSAAITRACPELAGSEFRMLAEGWHSTAIEVDGRLVFKFPKDDGAAQALMREVAVLAVVRPRVSLPVPELRIFPGPPVFSRHDKLHGDHLLSDGYGRLPEAARDRLGATLGRFYAELHAIDAESLAAAGALPIESWQSPDAVRATALPALDASLRDRAASIVAAFERLGPDPYGTTYGFFDGHGWNMAFDHQQGRLNGIYDFADSGFGPLHQEFVYASLVSPDLARRIVAAYEAETGKRLDRHRIAILTGYHRLSELAAMADDPRHAPMMIGHVAAWMAEADEL